MFKKFRGFETWLVFFYEEVTRIRDVFRNLSTIYGRPYLEKVSYYLKQKYMTGLLIHISVYRIQLYHKIL